MPGTVYANFLQPRDEVAAVTASRCARAPQWLRVSEQAGHLELLSYWSCDDGHKACDTVIHNKYIFWSLQFLAHSFRMPWNFLSSN